MWHYIDDFRRYYTLSLPGNPVNRFPIILLVMDRYPERPSNAPAVIPVNDILVDGYRTYARRIRRMLYLGGVLQNSTHSIVHSYATGFLVILVCITQVTLILNFCRDYSDNLVIVSKCLGLASSFMTPLLMVFSKKCALHIYKRHYHSIVHDQRNPRNHLAIYYSRIPQWKVWLLKKFLEENHRQKYYLETFPIQFVIAS